MEIRKEKKDSALSMAIEGRIDTTTAPQLETELKTDLDGVTELRLDFGQVEYISSAGLRVLLVDDDPLQLEMTAAMCRRAGVGCESCQYPEYVAKLVGESRFDLVLTDLQMPSADGFSVLAAVRGVDPAIPVVAWALRISRPGGLRGASASRSLTANWWRRYGRPAAAGRSSRRAGTRRSRRRTGPILRP